MKKKIAKFGSQKISSFVIKSYNFSETYSANEMVFFIAEFQRAAKIMKNAVYRFLISLLVPEL